MKVLHVITGLDAGGAEQQLATLLRHTRHESDVVVLYNPGPVADQIKENGTSVRNLGMGKNTEFRALATLYRIARDGRYDVVHAHLFRAQIYARPAARLARVPVVLTTEHSIGETHIERRKMSAGVHLLYLASELFSDATIAVSDVVRDRLVRWKVPAGKISVIPNGLEVDEFAYDPEARRQVREHFDIPLDAYLIGALGRLDSNKRVALTMEAAAPLLGERCRMLVIGRGEELPRLEAAAKSLGVAEWVIFGGYQADSRAMLAAFRPLRRRLGAGDVRARCARSPGERAPRALHHLPRPRWHLERARPPGRRNGGRVAPRDTVRDGGGIETSGGASGGLRSLRHAVRGQEDR